MRLAAITTLLFTTLVLANPAPNAAADAAPAPVEARAPADEHAAADALKARFAGILLEPREASTGTGGKGTGKGKGGSGSKNTTQDSAAADVMTPSRMLQAGAVGVGVIELVRLWG